MENVVLRLARILGKRAFLVCGLVTLLIVTLLATVNFSSRYALKLYVEDQIRRLPWDIALYQLGEYPISEEVFAKFKKVKGIGRAETVTFLRTMMTHRVQLEVDAKPFQATWISILSATDANLLPPEIRPKTGSNGGITMALTGPQNVMGKAFLALQGASKFNMGLLHEEEKHVDKVFSASLDKVIRTEISEMNRWFMDMVGSIFFIPDVGVILGVGNDPNILSRYDRFSRGMPPGEGDP